MAVSAQPVPRAEASTMTCEAAVMAATKGYSGAQHGGDQGFSLVNIGSGNHDNANNGNNNGNGSGILSGVSRSHAATLLPPHH